MSTDRELLALAAKAAGVTVQWSDSWGCFKRDARPVPLGCSEWLLWRPLTDDGDALRLAVKLRMNLWIFHDGAGANTDDDPKNYGETNAADPLTATRRAIVRAAAEIGRKQVAAQRDAQGEKT